MTAPRDAEDTTAQFNRLCAFRRFAEFEGRTQSQMHIRPLHEYVTCRLVLEGGFHPSELTPRPPLQVQTAMKQHRLTYDPEATTVSEATILGGLKTKDVDIVAVKEGMGELTADFPPGDSPIHFGQFFGTMYRRYDERYVVSAPTLAKRTRRLEWSPDSPAFEAPPFRALDYDFRIRA